MRVRELRIRYESRALPGPDVPDRFIHPAQVGSAFMRLLAHEAVEVCGVFCLSTRHDVLVYHELSRGTLDATAVHPREVFKAVLLANAAAVVLGHNHPSGDVTPSRDDFALTNRLVAAGSLLGIEVVDHVIVTSDQYFSFKTAGCLIGAGTRVEV